MILVLGLLFVTSISLPPPALRAADALDDKIEQASKQAQSQDEREHERGMQTLEATVEELEKSPAATQKNDESRRLFLLGKTYFYLDRQDDAGKYLDQALALAPNNAEYHFFRAQADAMNADAAAAEAQFLKATELAPKEARYWYGLGLCEGGAHKNDEAIAAFRKAIAADPKHAKATLMIGALLSQEGKTDEALAMFKQAADIDPTYELAFANIGQIYQNRGKVPEALAAYRQVLKLNPDDFRARSKVIQCEQALDQTKERDADRDAIFKLHASGKIEDEFYCRDQFSVGKTKVMVFEYFEPAGDQAVHYSFDVLDESGQRIASKISLSSPKFDNDLARSRGEIKGNERNYFIDADYPDGGHKTFGVYHKTEPNYEDFKKKVIEIVEGKVQPKSSSTPAR